MATTGNCPRKLLIQFSVAAMMSGSSAARTRIAAGSFTTGGTETLSVSREAGRAGYPARLADLTI